MTTADIPELRRRVDDARARIGKMCSEGRPPKMSIPANPDRDDDLVIDATFVQCLALLDELEALRGEVERKRQVITEMVGVVKRIVPDFDLENVKLRGVMINSVRIDEAMLDGWRQEQKEPGK